MHDNLNVLGVKSPVSGTVESLDMTKTCPSCGEATSLSEVIYGLPDGPPDEGKYVTAGCCTSERDPMTIQVATRLLPFRHAVARILWAKIHNKPRLNPN